VLANAQTESAAPALCSRVMLCHAVLCPQPAQSSLLSEVDGALRAEYAVRRRMLIERIKVRTGTQGASSTSSRGLVGKVFAGMAVKVFRGAGCSAYL
jgi:hypothetical protein